MYDMLHGVHHASSCIMVHSLRLAPHTQRYGVPNLPVTITTVEGDNGNDRPLDAVIAKDHVTAGQALIDIPEKLVISLDR